jgi:hypothetical protein
VGAAVVAGACVAGALTVAAVVAFPAFPTFVEPDPDEGDELEHAASTVAASVEQATAPNFRETGIPRIAPPQPTTLSSGEPRMRPGEPGCLEVTNEIWPESRGQPAA